MYYTLQSGILELLPIDIDQLAHDNRMFTIYSGKHHQAQNLIVNRLLRVSRFSYMFNKSMSLVRSISFVISLLVVIFLSYTTPFGDSVQ